MLKLPLPPLAQGEVRVEEDIAPDDPMFADLEATPVQPVHLDLRGRAVGDGVLVRGRIEATFEVPCRRCLTSVKIPLEDSVDLLFVPATELDEEDIGGEVYPLPHRGTELDLTEAIREQLVLRAPEYVVCDEECRGLCPQCGTDLNQGECGCVREPVASPWDALKNLERKQID